MRLRAKQGITAVVLDFTRVTDIDVSAIKAIEAIASDAKTDGRSVYTVGLAGKIKQMIAGLGADSDLAPENAFNTRMDALNAAKAGLA